MVINREEISYLPNQPEYIKDSKKYWKKTKAVDANGPIFLIIELDKDKPWRTESWLGNFSTYCRKFEKDLPWAVQIIELGKCP